MHMYNWQLEGWPKFEWDEHAFADKHYQFVKLASRLAGRLSHSKQDDRTSIAIDLMVQEAISSALIEGENISTDDVRSSIKNFLGLSAPPSRIIEPKAEGMAALMVSVAQTFDKPLTHEMLYEWQRLAIPDPTTALFGEIEVGKYRSGPMQVVSGPIGRERTHFVAPPADQVPKQMFRFIAWFNKTAPSEDTVIIPGLVRSAIAHLWFESIHPFSDGNGRVGRAIAEKALAQDFRSTPLFSLSQSLYSNRLDYYQQLKHFTGPTLDITGWISWFIDTSLQAQKEAEKRVDFILAKMLFWHQHEDKIINQRQKKMIDKFFDAGPSGYAHGVSASKYQNICRCSKATATRDLSELKQVGMLKTTGEGKATRYHLNIPDVHQAENLVDAIAAQNPLNDSPSLRY